MFYWYDTSTNRLTMVPTTENVGMAQSHSHLEMKTPNLRRVKRANKKHFHAFRFSTILFCFECSNILLVQIAYLLWMKIPISQCAFSKITDEFTVLYVAHITRGNLLICFRPKHPFLRNAHRRFNSAEILSLDKFWFSFEKEKTVSRQ